MIDSSAAFVCDGKSWQTLKAACGTVAYDPRTQFCDTRDNQVYKTAKIGSQTWMAENLNYDPGDVSSMSDDAWSGCYAGEDDNCAKYGRLFTWEVAMNDANCNYGNECDRGLSGVVQGICPEGWHLPAQEEWDALIDAVGESDNAGKMLKSASGWEDRGNGTDEYGFSALPAGHLLTGRIDFAEGFVADKDFVDEGNITNFWSSDEAGENSVFVLSLYYKNEKALLVTDFKLRGYSVRCLKDN